MTVNIVNHHLSTGNGEEDRRPRHKAYEEQNCATGMCRTSRIGIEKLILVMRIRAG